MIIMICTWACNAMFIKNTLNLFNTVIPEITDRSDFQMMFFQHEKDGCKQSFRSGAETDGFKLVVSFSTISSPNTNPLEFIFNVTALEFSVIVIILFVIFSFCDILSVPNCTIFMRYVLCLWIPLVIGNVILFCS